MTTLLNDRARIKMAVNRAVRERSKTPLQRAKERNDEIVRQYLENGIKTEQIADLMEMEHWRVRQILRSRGLNVGIRKNRIDKFGSIYMPAEFRKRFPSDARFTCELVEDGILYRLVDEADRGAAA